jgi:hypothetical protein
MAGRRIDTNELQVGQEQSFNMPASGAIKHSDFHDNFEVVDDPMWKDQAELMAFMEELVEIVVSEDNHPNAEQVINLSVNGINQFVFRGKPQVIKRKYIEVLARSRPESLSTPEYTDANGNRATRIVKAHTLRFPFRVIKDMNPKGGRWVENLLREG